MPPSPATASGAWRPASPRSLPGTHDKTASGFGKHGGRNRSHPALDRANQGRFLEAAVLHPHKENTTLRARPPDRKSQIRGGMRWCGGYCGAAPRRHFIGRSHTAIGESKRALPDEAGQPRRRLPGMPSAVWVCFPVSAADPRWKPAWRGSHPFPPPGNAGDPRPWRERSSR
jgi:hypothetical protein